MSQQTSIGSHKTSVFTEEDTTKVVYHNTAVVSFNQDQIIINGVEISQKRSMSCRSS